MTVLACDIGGSRIKLGVVRGGEVLACDSIDADSHLGLRAALPRVGDALEDLTREAGVDRSDCRGVGMGFPALVDSRRGRVLNEYGKYRDAPAIDLNAWAEETLALPLALENDARLALMGEWAYGAGRGSDNVAILTLGTGVGSAVILEGRPLRGEHASAGNLLGHTIVNVGGRLCACGNRGCVEAETGTAYLADCARETPGFAASALARSERIDYATLCRLAQGGDDFSGKLLRRATRLWAALCVNVIQAYDVDRIVIGGGVMESADVVLPMIREAIDESGAPWWGGVDLRPAEHPTNMALLGCEALVAHQLEEAPYRSA